MKPYGDRRLRRSNRIEGLIREKETHILPHARELLFLALTSLVLLAYVADVGNAIKPATISGSASTPEHQRLTPDGQSRLRALVNSATLPDLRWPNFERYRTEVTQFYDSFGSLAWVQDSKPTPQARAIITILKGADLEGLRPEDYDGPNWNAHLAVFQQPLQPSEWDLIRFDVAITVSTMRYLSDLHLGRVNPRLFHFEFDTQGNAIALSDFLQQKLVDSPDVLAEIQSVEPPFPAYRRTINALRNYLELAQHDDGPSLPPPQKPVRPGDSYVGMPRLVELLQILGDLAPGASAEVIYSPALAEAVRHFQRRHGLDVNGLLDVPTMRELNVPPARRILQLQLTLERWRWVPHQFDRPPIVINIPEFRLHTDDEQYHWLQSMKVVVGRAYRHQTPVFASEVKSVIFRPYWNVPLSIQRAELLPHIEQNPSYLAEHSYEIVDRNGNVVTGNNASKEELARASSPLGKSRVPTTH